MSEHPHDYYTYTEALIPEGRRVFALSTACDMLDTDTPTAKILKMAKLIEDYLAGEQKPKKAKPKVTVVKNDGG